MRRKIKSDFKTVKFINVDGLLYAYLPNIKLEDVITLYIDTKRELNKIKEINERFTKEQQNLVICINSVKKEINRLEDNLPWPPEPQDLVPDKFLIPSLLDLMFQFLLQNDQVVMQPKSESLKLSFAQVTVYAVTNGRIKTPKSILLPTLIKSLTNNTEIINVINKLSHGVSFTVLMETHTENAYKILEQQLENTFILPLDCQREEYTTYIADNIDIKEETLSGNKICTYFFEFNFPYLTTLVSFQPIIFKLQKRY